jgi:hypothetical protein
MVDQSGVVKLRDMVSNAVVASHSYGAGAIRSYVQFDATTPSYQTNFRRGDVGATGAQGLAKRKSILSIWMAILSSRKQVMP